MPPGRNNKRPKAEEHDNFEVQDPRSTKKQKVVAPKPRGRQPKKSVVPKVTSKAAARPRVIVDLSEEDEDMTIEPPIVPPTEIVAKITFRPEDVFPRFLAGDTIIQLVAGRQKYEYRLHSSILSRASDWFDKTLRQHMAAQEPDPALALHVKNKLMCLARYELEFNLQLDMHVLGRSALTRIKVPQVVKPTPTEIVHLDDDSYVDTVPRVALSRTSKTTARSDAQVDTASDVAPSMASKTMVSSAIQFPVTKAVPQPKNKETDVTAPTVPETKVSSDARGPAVKAVVLPKKKRIAEQHDLTLQDGVPAVKKESSPAAAIDATSASPLGGIEARLTPETGAMIIAPPGIAQTAESKDGALPVADAVDSATPKHNEQADEMAASEAPVIALASPARVIKKEVSPDFETSPQTGHVEQTVAQKEASPGLRTPASVAQRETVAKNEASPSLEATTSTENVEDTVTKDVASLDLEASASTEHGAEITIEEKRSSSPKLSASLRSIDGHISLQEELHALNMMTSVRSTPIEGPATMQIEKGIIKKEGSPAAVTVCASTEVVEHAQTKKEGSNVPVPKPDQNGDLAVDQSQATPVTGRGLVPDTTAEERDVKTLDSPSYITASLSIPQLDGTGEEKAEELQARAPTSVSTSTHDVGQSHLVEDSQNEALASSKHIEQAAAKKDELPVPVSIIYAVPKPERGQLTEDILQAYNNLFLIYYSNPPILDTANINTALAQTELLLRVAYLYDSMPSVRPYLNSHLMQFGRDLYTAIMIDPLRWLLLSIGLECAPVFKEAIIHIVGNYSYRPWPTSKFQGMPAEVLDLIASKREEFRGKKNAVDHSLLTATLQVNSIDVTLASEGITPIHTWLTVQLWKDHFTRSFAAANAKCKVQQKCVNATMYRTLLKGTYLEPQFVVEKLKAVRSQDKLRPFSEEERKDVEDDLLLMKKYAQKEVAPLCVNESMLSVEDAGIEYFTCFKVENNELPWAQPALQ